MKKYVVALIIGLCAIAAVGVHAAPPSDAYQLLLSDEFDGNALNTELWDYRSGNPYGGKNLAENVRVENGNLYVDYRITDGTYTGGGVLTKFNLPYGYYETRAKVFGDTGVFHTSFWLSGGSAFTTQPTNYPQKNCMIEIDGFEIDSHNKTNLSYGTHYWWNGANSVYRKSCTDKDWSAEWFTMGIEWLPDRVNFYVDGELIGTQDDVSVYGPSYLWLTAVAMPEGKENLIDDSKVNGASVFDYVRYYQRPLKNVNLLGNGNFEYDKGNSSVYPYCYIIKGDTAASVAASSTEAYDGVRCLYQGSTTPYSVSAGQEFCYLTAGKYTFSGKFKATEGLTTARLAVYDKDGNVIAQKNIPQCDAWTEVALVDIPITGYAYVTVESASNGGTVLAIDDLQFFSQEGEVYTAINTPNYESVTGQAATAVANSYDSYVYTYANASASSGNWSASGLQSGSYWTYYDASAYVQWDIPITQTGEYYFDVHALIDANNAECQQYAVSVNNGAETVYTVDMLTESTGWRDITALNVSEGDTVTVRMTPGGTKKGVLRVSEIRLLPTLQKQLYETPAMWLEKPLTIYQGRIYKGDALPYVQNGVYYLPTAVLKQTVGVLQDTAEAYISATDLETQTGYKLLESNNMLLLVKNTESDYTLAANLFVLAFADYETTPLVSSAVYSGTAEASEAAVYSFDDAFTTGNWVYSSLHNGNYYANGDAAAIWYIPITKTGKYSVQIESVSHANTTDFAKITVVGGKENDVYAVNQKTGASGWYTLGDYVLEKGGYMLVRLQNGSGSSYVRASSMRLIPQAAAEARYMGNDTPSDATEYGMEYGAQSGSWSASSVGGFYSGSTNAKVEWTGNAPAKGKYSIEIYSPAYYGNSTEEAAVRYALNNQTPTVYTINQNTGSAGWYALAVTNLTPQDSFNITIENNGTQYLRAFKIRLVPIADQATVSQNGTQLTVTPGYGYHYFNQVLFAEYNADGSFKSVKGVSPAAQLRFTLSDAQAKYKIFFWHSIGSMQPYLQAAGNF